MSTADHVKVDPEFKSLIPALSEEESKQLEDNILLEGCRDSLVTWDGLLLDGHNRFEICNKHNLNFYTLDMDFDSREDAKIWIIKNQFGRRNLPAYERARLALQLKEIIGAKAMANMSAGGGDKRSGLTNSPNPVIEPVNTRKEIAKAAGVGEQLIARVEVIEEKASPEQKEKLRKGEASINEVYTAIRREEKKEHKAVKAQALQGTEIFNVILADPAWQYDNTGVDGAAEHHYNTMPLEDICGLLEDINLRVADNAVLFMWVTNPFLEEAFKVTRAWNFSYKTNIAWVKTELKKAGSGFYVRGRHELLFICTRGAFTPIDQNISPPIGSVIEAPVQDHSRKPEEIYQIIETLYPNCNYIELFARSKREGWQGWGNEYGE